jgi:MHS family proline/betaine transporter-like MFS transporter
VVSASRRPDTWSEGRLRRRALTAGAIGNFVEWYDFVIYASFVPIISGLFFPSADRTASLSAAIAVFGVAFVFRPLGGLTFGHVGDRVGRKNTLATAVILMSVATAAIGILPTYAQIGVLAPLLLVAARVAQDSRQVASGVDLPPSWLSMHPKTAAGTMGLGKRPRSDWERRPAR